MPRSTLVEQPFHPPSLMYDNPSSFQVEDFFNLDLLSGSDDAARSASASTFSSTAAPLTDSARGNRSASSTSSPSRASSEARTDSPTGSFANLRTPPQAESLPSFDVTGLGMGMGINFDTNTFDGLPPIEEESIFTMGSTIGNDFFKPGTDPLAGLSHSPFDLFGSFDSGLGGATSSDAHTTPSASTVNSSSSTASDNNTSLPFSAIDPQLVRTSAASTSTGTRSDVGADPDSDEDEQDGLLVAPVKVGGKGKARRGTLHSGGVSKKSALPGPQSIFGSLPSVEGSAASLGKGSGKVAGKTKEGGKSFGKEKSLKDKDRDDEDEKDEDPDDWRPSPEEYAKMSSKEKRQLRNKISARNFRIRRKEYIHTLEGDIADRDRLIDAIRTELGSTKSENHTLRQEVAALKRAILEGRASPMLPPPAPLSPLSPISSFATLPGSSSSNNNVSSSSGNSSSSHTIIKPNTHKDLPTSPRLGASPFWGGQTGAFGSLGGGITPVHTAIIPETAATVFGSSTERQKENINPALNVQAHQQPQQQQVLSQVLTQLYGSGEANGASTNINNKNAHGVQNAFDSFGFADVNPFTLKTLDAYRMQLWGRVAAQTHHAQRSRATDSSNNTGYPSPPHSSPCPSPSANANASANVSVPLSGLASSLRPQYFAAANSHSTASSSNGTPFGALLSGKGLPSGHHAHHALPTPPPSPQSRAASRQQQQAHKEQVQTHALLATFASQTLLQKLGSAFWDAFSGASSSGSATSHNNSWTLRSWDTEKVRRVLEGTAVLRVVDVDRPFSSSASTSSSDSAQTSADTLTDTMRSLSLDNNVKDEKTDNGRDSERKGLFARMHCGGCNKRH